MGEPGTSSGEASGGATGGDSRLDDIDPELVAGMTADELKKFIDTGRTGRRNALPDVNQHDAATTSTAGVAEALESLSVKSGASSSEDKKSVTGAAGGS